MSFYQKPLSLVFSALLLSGTIFSAQSTWASEKNQICSFECISLTLEETEAEMTSARKLDINGLYQQANESYERILQRTGARGHPIAAARIAYSHVKALGRPIDTKRAEDYANRALASGLLTLADAGNAEALYYRGLLKQHGVGLSQDIDAALEDFKAALAAGEPYASIAIADHPSLERDIVEQLQILRESADNDFLPGLARYAALVLEIDTNMGFAEGLVNETEFFKTKQGIKSVVGDARPILIWKNSQFEALIDNWDTLYSDVLEDLREAASDHYPSLALLHFFALQDREIGFSNEQLYEKLDTAERNGYNAAEFLKPSIAAQISLLTGNKEYELEAFKFLLAEKEATHPRALIAQGEFLITFGEYEKAKNNFTRAMSYGSLGAYIAMGDLYRHNWYGMKRRLNPHIDINLLDEFSKVQTEGAEKAAPYYEFAAKKGSPRAALFLVSLGMGIDGGAEDKERVKKWATELIKMDHYTDLAKNLLN